ncbi:MAG: tRNA (adenosine(37)-N6)-dimethylallyltransferase MiaA, partial [bacterium]|nr:tRNA (adenosine(37)-N6)-dimethylallyltransferase MiaA [bacterium]
GKSSLGVFLAKKLGGEIISADSRQVYKGLDIGTGKVTKKEMAGIPHHLLDVANPKKQFSVDDFVKMAEKTIRKIMILHNIVIVVGGTGLYIDMLLGRMSYPNVPPNPRLRAQLEKKSVKQLFAQFKKLDPRRAKTIEPEHKRRLIRAIEIVKTLGPNSQSRSVAPRKYKVLWLGLNPGEKKLRNKIRIRLFARIGAGMIAEAKKLHRAGLSYKRMGELGLEYRYLARLLQKKITQKEFKIELERAIINYAKRQMRWFKRNPEITWVKNKSEALRLAQQFVTK